MKPLSKSNCEACSADAKKLSAAQIESLLQEINNWELITDDNIQKLSRCFDTGNYAKSMAFTNAVAELAQASDHHPLLIVEYGTVTVVWWSHKIKGLHLNDFIMASRTSDAF
jgi:4a-hydroxytetrahydrobiopterin dehydratase